MASPRESREKKQELPSRYFVQDRSNREELIRLDEQDRLAAPARSRRRGRRLLAEVDARLGLEHARGRVQLVRADGDDAPG